MNILSRNGKILVNYDNVSSLCIQKRYTQYSHPDTWWEIWALYPAVSSDIIYDILAGFEDREECESVFKRIVHEICELKLDFVQV